jgi:Amidohydrolase ring-opening protein (Amido_AtzD_TrzD)
MKTCCHTASSSERDNAPRLPGTKHLVTLGTAERGQRSRVVALLAKAEAGMSGRLRGVRHTMLDDSDISATHHARAFVAGVLADS